MSLVSEALRKARREAARRGLQPRGPAPPYYPVGPERSGRFGSGLVLGAAIALAAAGGGAVAMWWLLAGERGSGSGAPVGAAPSGSAATPAQIASSPTPRPADAPLGTASPSPPSPEGDPELLAAPEPTPAQPAVVAQPSPPASPAAPPSGEVREFVAEAELGYASLSLGYVVYRATDPFAEVNGREVHVGGEVDGFTVEEITASAVRLRDERGPLVLKVR